MRLDRSNILIIAMVAIGVFLVWFNLRLKSHAPPPPAPQVATQPVQKAEPPPSEAPPVAAATPQEESIEDKRKRLAMATEKCEHKEDSVNCMTAAKIQLSLASPKEARRLLEFACKIAYRPEVCFEVSKLMSADEGAEMGSRCTGGDKVSCLYAAGFAKEQKKPDEAKRFSEAACDRGMRLACVSMGEFINSADASAIESKCNSSDAKSCLILAGYHQALKDDDGFKTFLDRACGVHYTGELDACMKWGRLATEKEIKPYEPKCQAGDKAACVRRVGFQFTKENTAEEKVWLAAACKAGLTEGCAFLKKLESF